MNANITRAAGELARLIATMPAGTSWEWQQQDITVAEVLELLAAAVAGNGDAAQIITTAAEDIRDTVYLDRKREDA